MLGQLCREGLAEVEEAGEVALGDVRALGRRRRAAAHGERAEGLP
jgi:hypothetical protein